MRLDLLHFRFTFFSSLLLVIGIACRLDADTGLNIAGYRIEFHDEFESDSVDSSKWEVNVGVNAWYQRASDGRFVEPHWFNEEFEPWISAGTINGERQYYSPDNVSVDAGVLEIRAKKETVTNPVGLYDPGFHQYTSGKLNTADEYQFQFGIVKWRAQLPAGQGLWPALWMLNAPNPWFWDDEIDVMEARGAHPTVTTSAHHFKVDVGGGNLQNQYNASDLDTGMNLQAGFHEYSLEWDSSSIRTRVDGRQVLFDTQEIPQGPMFLIMNAAVGGGFGGDPDGSTIFPTSFKIDWVRVWQPASTPSDLASGGFEDVQGAQWANWNTLDDGNLSARSSGAFHGTHAVQIDRRNNSSTGTRGPNLLTDGTATEWRGYLNQLTSDGQVTSGGPVDPSTIPATTSDDSMTLPIHQSAPSPGANAVVYRQLDGAFAQGRDLTFSGTVTISETFPAGTSALAFIRIFNADYSFTDVATSVKTGGEFSLQAAIPASGIPIIQVGLETSGPTGSAGILVATNLYLEEDGAAPSDPENRTGLVQTVTAIPGQPVKYGLLAANHPSNPIGPGAAGRLRLEFFDAAETLLAESSTLIIDSDSPAQAIPFSLESVTPANAAYVRLTIERITTDPETDLAGSLIVDAAFLQVPGTTELPVFVSEPASELILNAGESVSLPIEVNSPTPVTYQWYRLGATFSSEEDLLFTATPDSGGTYFVIAENAAGPVIGAVTQLTVLNPDTDSDQISDYDETTIYGTNPSQADTDSDGFNDFDEIFVLLTDPTDPLSLLKIIHFELNGGQVAVTFQSVSGVHYFIEGSADLSNWQFFGSDFIATEDVSILIESVPVSDPPLRFFRIGSDL